MAGILVSPTIHSDTGLPIAAAIAFNLGLIAIFGLQHSGMSRRTFKTMTARLVAPGLERAAYVWAAVLALGMLVGLFQPIPVSLWHFHSLSAQVIMWALFVLGWSIAAAAYLSAGIFYLLGVSQALAWSRGAPLPPPPLVQGFAYRYVRNPQQLGLLLAFWATPHMTLGQAIFAGALTLYIFIGISLEEKDLLTSHGDEYAAYRERVPRIIPRFF
ncbi:MAG: isoprenylcysteine carboxylmethyltransferase family protein [Rhodobacteraceae bacterium]|nr:isoprenylcysteine carboxylmethyltransferase family protein [Paracoccaceae bacterium]